VKPWSINLNKLKKKKILTSRDSSNARDDNDDNKFVEMHGARQSKIMVKGCD
jgi:hypothetical protein